jgi:hypothetical protein
MAERVGFEPTHPRRQDLECKADYDTEEAPSSPLASLKSTPLCPDLQKIVHAWPNLRHELRAAMLALIASP